MVLSVCTQLCYERHKVPENLLTISDLSILLHGVISLQDTTSYDKIQCIQMHIMFDN